MAGGWEPVCRAGGRLLRFIYVSFHFDSFAYLRTDGGGPETFLRLCQVIASQDILGSCAPPSNRLDFFFFFFFFESSLW